MPVRFRTAKISGLRGAVAFVAALVAGGLGCASTPTLQIKKMNVAVAAPANVAMYLKVTRPDGQPVTLLASDFKVIEDGKPIPARKLKKAILPTTAVLERYVSIVVDLSGPLVDSEYLSTLYDALGTLIDRIGKDTHLSLAAFDGDGLRPFVAFDDAEQKTGLGGMRRFHPHNRVVDLWGTYIAALDALDQAASHATAPQHTSRLIFVTDRRDKAGKHTLDEANDKLQASPSDSLIIGLGDATNKDELRRLGRPEAFFTDKFRDLRQPFEQVADHIEAERNGDIVFAYCSVQKPSRKAKHTVELHIENKDVHGDVAHEFSTAAFSKATCDPRQKPDFAAKEDAPSTDSAAPDESGGDEDAPKPKKKKRKPRPADDEDSEG